MKIFYWPASMIDGTYRYRIEMPAGELVRRGHEVQTSQRVGMWTRDEAQVIIAQRVCMAAPSAMWLMLSESPRRKRGDLKLVFELDDDLFSIDPRQNAFAATFKHAAVRQNLADNIRIADLVTVSTEPLAEVIRKINPNVVVLANCVDEKIFDVPLVPWRGRPYHSTSLGWQGSATHEEDWEIVRPYVTELLNADTGLRMRFLGNAHGRGLPWEQLDYLRWTTDLFKHYRRVTKFDVGLAPLNDTLFNRSKSGLRFTEYAALGVPSVCSDVPAYRAVVEHGVTGFLAKRPDQWRKHLRDLAYDPAMRLEIGDAARAKAREWTIQARGHLWEAAYASLFASEAANV